MIWVSLPNKMWSFTWRIFLLLIKIWLVYIISWGGKHVRPGAERVDFVVKGHTLSVNVLLLEGHTHYQLQLYLQLYLLQVLIWAYLLVLRPETFWLRALSQIQQIRNVSEFKFLKY